MQKRRNTKVIAATASGPQEGSDPLSENLTLNRAFTCVEHEDWVKGSLQRALDQIRPLCDKNRMQESVEVGGELGHDSCAIEPKLIVDFVPLMFRMAIRSTRPDLVWDIAPSESLIEKLWRVVKDSANPAYYFPVKPWIYRWYEHHQGHHKQAFLMPAYHNWSESFLTSPLRYAREFVLQKTTLHAKGQNGERTWIEPSILQKNRYPLVRREPSIPKRTPLT